MYGGIQIHMGSPPYPVYDMSLSEAFRPDTDLSSFIIIKSES